MENHACSAIEIALLTPPGRGALAVVGVAGPGALDLVARCFTPRGRRPLTERPDGAIVFGRWGNPERGEELVVVRHAVDRLEVHCHGGLAASDAVIMSLTSSIPSGQQAAGREPAGHRTSRRGCNPPGSRPVFPGGVCTLSEEPGEDALGQITLRLAIEAEARDTLALAGGPQAARILCRQLAGALGNECARIKSLRQAGDKAAADRATERLLLASRVGLRLLDPWRVVVSGPVNAGKSSLVNALAGYARCIVSAEPGTTRDVVTTRLVLGGWEIDLIDTAGLRNPNDATSATERAGIERALAVARTADLVLDVRQAGSLTETPPSLAHISLPAIRPDAELPRCITIFSKCDLAPGFVAPPTAIITSAVNGEGIDALAAAIVAAVVPEEKADPELIMGPVPFTSRQLATLGQ